MDQETGWVQLIDLSVHTALTTTHHQPTSSKYGGEQIIYGPGHVMPVQSRDNRPILTRSGVSTHTTPQSTTNFAMKTTSQHSDVIYQTKAKGMLYTYWHSFMILVLVYNGLTKWPYFCDRRSPIFISTPQLTLLKVLAHCAPNENFWRERNVWCFQIYYTL